MKDDKLKNQTFAETMSHLITGKNPKKLHLLLGNGFSMSYDYIKVFKSVKLFLRLYLEVQI